MARIALVVTSHRRLGDTERPTGYYLEEVAVPYYALLDAGHQVELVSIPGGPVSADPNSLKAGEKTDSSSARFLADPAAQAAISDTRAVASLDPIDYDGVWVAGGHGAMWDLPEDPSLAGFIGALFDAGKLVSAVCHGPAGLVSARRADGASILDGRRVTGFHNAEEEAVGLDKVVPFLLETRIRQLGGIFENASIWADHAVRDGNLITGQNPQSAGSTTKHLLAALREADQWK